LDSTLEIAFKEFLVNDSGSYYSDAQLLDLFSKKYKVYAEIKKYPRGKLITKNEWKIIRFYDDQRNKLVHQRASVNLPDRDIEIFSDTVKSVLKKLFGFNFEI
jgi:hypothetical protein